MLRRDALNRLTATKRRYSRRHSRIAENGKRKQTEQVIGRIYVNRFDYPAEKN